MRGARTIARQGWSAVARPSPYFEGRSPTAWAIISFIARPMRTARIFRRCAVIVMAPLPLADQAIAAAAVKARASE